MRYNVEIRKFVEAVPTCADDLLAHLKGILLKKVLSPDDIQILIEHLTHDSQEVRDAVLSALQTHPAAAIECLEAEILANSLEAPSLAAALKVLRSPRLPAIVFDCFSSEEDAGPKTERIPMVQTNTDVSNSLPQIQNRFEKDLPSLLQSDPGKWIAYSVDGPVPVPADFNLRRVYKNCWNLGLDSTNFMVLPIEPLHTSTLELVTSCDSTD